MAILKVARLGHPVLRRVADPVEPREIRGPEIQRLVRDMLETMSEYNGVGLAAPQVHVSRRVVVSGGGETEEGEPLVRVLINPEIRPTTTATGGLWEGCLSIPGLRGYVERPRAVDVKAWNEKGERVQFSLEGFPAIVIQHEVDHLDGVLFVDRLRDTRLLAFEEEAERWLNVAPEDEEDVDQAMEGDGR